MAYDKSWFEERIGETVVRINGYTGERTDETVTEENVGRLWLETEKGIRYEEKKRPRVHVAPGNSACISCEG